MPPFTGRSPRGERGLKRLLRRRVASAHKGRSPRGERGLKLGRPCERRTRRQSRSPRGERGLKHVCHGVTLGAKRMSLPARGAWIETVGSRGRQSLYPLHEPQRRSPRGERGLKLQAVCIKSSRGSPGRSPRGERGLKPRQDEDRRIGRPREIETQLERRLLRRRSPRGERGLKQGCASSYVFRNNCIVAPREGSVD